ncbi:MAG TPA: 2-C-methyl-D-erythritol 4-phosphate cytidylyltransferase [Vicinamibacterales bacterium]|nr:2-C-methyl-D-erythritol 4-phosphate cytidylyltransferase [Vicinamibacterales bacterium]
MHVSAIIAAGGRGTRFGGAHPKQIASLGGRSILQRSVDAFLESRCVTDIVVALPPELASNPPVNLQDARKPIDIVAGGARRQDSVANAFAIVSGRADVVVIHDAARPLVTSALIERTVEAAAQWGAAIAAVAAHDTVKRVRDNVIVSTLSRDEIYLAQTPQAFRVAVLRDALAAPGDVTDEASLAERAGHPVRIVEGDPLNLKITAPRDLDTAERLLAHRRPGPSIRVGNGYDLHRLVPDRRLVLAGVAIPFDKGLEGHSDADVVCHAVTDAILGASGAGDIGRHFPDTDPAWKDADSVELLRRAAALVREKGFEIANVDVVVIAQKPKLLPYLATMVANLAGALAVDPGEVSIKGKTNEGVDSMGTGESIAVHAVALVTRIR